MEKITIKTWFLYSFGILLLVVVLYSFNAKLNGIDTQIEINHELKRRVMRYKSDLVTFEMEN
jgi:hypothetical protein